MQLSTPERQPAFATFRTDASVVIGTGHLRRCLTLAETLAARGWRCGFAVASGTIEAAPWLTDAPHECYVLDDAGEWPEGPARRWPDGCDFLITDRYDIDSTFESRARPWARHILAIDDLANRKHDCDLLLDQNIGRRAQDYSGLVPQHCRFLLGPANALLRPEFAQRRSTPRKIRETVGQILVTLGGSDPRNITAHVIAALDGLGAAAPEAVVVAGSANPHVEKLKATAATNNRIEVVHSIDDMAEAMAQADIAVTGSGGTCWELAAMGLPAIAIEESAGGVAAALDAAGVVLRLGLEEGQRADVIAGALGALVADPARRETMAAAGRALVDGAGADRVAACMDAMIVASTGDPVTGISEASGA